MHVIPPVLSARLSAQVGAQVKECS